MQEGFFDIVLKEGHEQRVHHGDVKVTYAGEKGVELPVLTGTGHNTCTMLKTRSKSVSKAVYLLQLGQNTPLNIFKLLYNGQLLSKIIIE